MSHFSRSNGTHKNTAIWPLRHGRLQSDTYSNRQFHELVMRGQPCAGLRVDIEVLRPVFGLRWMYSRVLHRPMRHGRLASHSYSRHGTSEVGAGVGGHSHPRVAWSYDPVVDHPVQKRIIFYNRRGRNSKGFLAKLMRGHRGTYMVTAMRDLDISAWPSCRGPAWRKSGW